MTTKNAVDSYSGKESSPFPASSGVDKQSFPKRIPSLKEIATKTFVDLKLNLSHRTSQMLTRLKHISKANVLKNIALAMIIMAIFLAVVAPFLLVSSLCVLVAFLGMGGPGSGAGEVIGIVTMIGTCHLLLAASLLTVISPVVYLTGKVLETPQDKIDAIAARIQQCKKRQEKGRVSDDIITKEIKDLQGKQSELMKLTSGKK